MTGKSPAVQFYFGDWLKDTQLQCATPATRGIWANFFCYMPEALEKGVIRGDIRTLCQLGACTAAEMRNFIKEAEALKFCNVKHNRDKSVTITNRRMRREQVAREQGRERQRKYRKMHDGNADITTLSSSSSSSSSSKRAIKDTSYKEKVLAHPITSEKVKEWSDTYKIGAKELWDELGIAYQWLLDHPNKQKRQFNAFYSRWIKKYAQDKKANPSNISDVANSIAERLEK